MQYINCMSRVHANIDTFYGDFPADFEFTISSDEISGEYSFIGYIGNFHGSMTGPDTFSVSGVVDSYVGKIDFSITGRYDGRNVSGEGVTANKGRFTVRGIIIGDV